jgi:hypothetical protein
MMFHGSLEERTELVGIQIKSHRGTVSGQTIYQATHLADRLGLDRILLIALGSFSNLARERAGTDPLGRVDALDLKDLRNWLARRAASVRQPVRNAQIVMKQAMRDLARLLALTQAELADIEWRDMERLLGEVFEALGFNTEVTRSSKDGGFDLKLIDDFGDCYLVEVKHWETAVGAKPLKKLLHVSAREGAAGSLLLSSSGFTANIFDSLIEIGPPAHLGDGQKIIALCRIFYRIEAELWQPDLGLAELLFQDTISAHSSGN